MGAWNYFQLYSPFVTDKTLRAYRYSIAISKHIFRRATFGKEGVPHDFFPELLLHGAYPTILTSSTRGPTVIYPHNVHSFLPLTVIHSVITTHILCNVLLAIKKIYEAICENYIFAIKKKKEKLNPQTQNEQHVRNKLIK